MFHTLALPNGCHIVQASRKEFDFRDRDNRIFGAACPHCGRWYLWSYARYEDPGYVTVANLWFESWDHAAAYVRDMGARLREQVLRN